MKKETTIIPVEIVENKIYLIRGIKVMLSVDLAKLYQTEPRILIQSVKRNMERFPSDFMFQLTSAEFVNLKSQIVTSSWGGLRRALPYAFTEHGVTMLSSVLKSKKAIEVNISIIRAFVKLRELMATHKDLAQKIENLERKYNKHDKEIQIVFQAIKQLLSPTLPKIPKEIIGFKPKNPKK